MSGSDRQSDADRRKKESLEDSFRYLRTMDGRDYRPDLYRLANSFKTVAAALELPTEGRYKLTKQLWRTIQKVIFDTLITNFPGKLLVYDEDGAPVQPKSCFPEEGAIAFLPDECHRADDIFKMGIERLYPSTKKSLANAWKADGDRISPADFNETQFSTNQAVGRQPVLGDQLLSEEASLGHEKAHHEWLELKQAASRATDESDREKLIQCMADLEAVWGNLASRSVGPIQPTGINEPVEEMTVEAKKSVEVGAAIAAPSLKQDITEKLLCVQAKYHDIATWNDWYLAVAYAIRDRVLKRWIATTETSNKTSARKVCYLSAEFLLGPLLLNNIINLGLYDESRQAAEDLGLDFDDLIDHESEPGLGNGGLGRLAACYLDSLSTLGIPAVGYGLRYEYGIFNQVIRNGYQVESTDKWLLLGNPWEVARPERTFEVKLGGHCDGSFDESGRYRVKWIPSKVVKGVPYDTPIVGYNSSTANTLRLWKAEAVESFDFFAFNVGDYLGSVQEKLVSENISKILYPNDESSQGKQLRLEQQHFFVSCSLQDQVALHKFEGLENFHKKVTMQLNDTHPSIAVAELMRLLIDEHDMHWDHAWDITRQTFAYTNHTLLSEALERWPLELFSSVLPRHMQIIHEINHRFLEEVRKKFPGDDARLSRLSIIDESGPRYVRMAHLAAVGCYAINGVAELHSELLKESVLKDFYDMYPEKFLNVTNGVTPRRWIVAGNPRQTKLLNSKFGDGWVTDLDQLHRLEDFLDDGEFRADWRKSKRAMKRALARVIEDTTGVVVDLDSLFDIQVKRIHEYKRQHLNVLHIVSLYNRIKNDPSVDILPRTFVFGGKAAPGYFMAKLIIKLINSVGVVINADKDVAGRLKVVFLPNFSVKLGQRVYPAAELSEQISQAGKEASGTGNMKFSLNGALTIGTMDGANVEIREEVGNENFFLFGLTVEEVGALRRQGYNPRYYYDRDEELRAAIDTISSGCFSDGDRQLFAPLVDSLMYQDEYMAFADFRSYVNCQQQVSATYSDQDRWTTMSILNVARCGKFSSDRSIREYCDHIWKVRLPRP